MSNPRAKEACSDVATASKFYPAKVPRERLVRLHVEAVPSDRVFARVLRLVTGAAIIPVDITLEHGAKNLSIDILFDRESFAPSTWILAQIEGVPSIKSADFLDLQGRSLFPAKESDDGDLIAVASLVDGGGRRGGVGAREGDAA